MKTITKKIPLSWAISMINSDTSGMNNSELEIMETFEKDLIKDGFLPIPCNHSNETDFTPFHDVSYLGVPANDCILCTFQKLPTNTK